MPTSLFTTRILAQTDNDWSAVIADLEAAGLDVPLPARKEWVPRGGRRLLVVADDRQGRASAAIALEIEPTLALPGHHLARAYRLGTMIAGAAGEAALERLLEYAATDKRLLRINLEFILLESETRARVASMLTAHGFRRADAPRSYTNTLILDLVHSEDELLRSFSEQARRHLRLWPNAPVEIRPILEPRYADRLNELVRQSFARTGGNYEKKDWVARIDLCERLPAQCRLIGLFRSGDTDPDALLAFAWGCSHGDHAHYDDAGSVRVDDIKVSMMYPLVWDLIKWAKSNGCQWFDLGGIPSQRLSASDPMAGITGFKSRFSKIAVPVGIEWEFLPHPRRARIAAAVRAAAGFLGATRHISASR